MVQQIAMMDTGMLISSAMGMILFAYCTGIGWPTQSTRSPGSIQHRAVPRSPAAENWKRWKSSAQPTRFAPSSDDLQACVG
jgi:hypothetical protein